MCNPDQAAPVLYSTFMEEKNESGRYHGIDALRAFAMILGIFLHASIVYKVNPLPVWPADPGSALPLFDYLYFFIHTFRMPLFFLGVFPNVRGPCRYTPIRVYLTQK